MMRSYSDDLRIRVMIGAPGGVWVDCTAFLIVDGGTRVYGPSGALCSFFRVLRCKVYSVLAMMIPAPPSVHGVGTSAKKTIPIITTLQGNS